MTYCIIELVQVKEEPPWDDKLVVVPIIFLKPEVKGCDKGESSVLYPSMPHTPLDKETIQDFVVKNVVPPDTWGVKRCKVKNAAPTYALAVELLAAAKAAMKVPKKRKAPQNKETKNLVPMSTIVKKVSQQNPGRMNLPKSGPVLYSLPPAPDGSNEVLTDVSNIGGMRQQLSSTADNSTGEEINWHLNHEAQEAALISHMKDTLFTMPNGFGSSAESMAAHNGGSIMNLKDPVCSSSSAIVGNESDSPQQHHPELTECAGTSTSFSTEQMDMMNYFETEDNHSLNEQSVISKSSLVSDSVLVEEVQVPAVTENNVTYIIMTKNDLLEFGKDLIAQANSATQDTGKSKLNQRLDNIDLNLKEVKSILAQQKPQTKDFMTLDEFKDTYNLGLPLETLKSFNDFDGLISRNAQEIRSSLKKVIKSTCNYKCTAEDNCWSMIRRFITNEVIGLYTASNPSGTKPIFNKTAFFSCMYESLAYVHMVDGKQGLDDKILAHYVGNLINSSRTIVRKSAAGRKEREMAAQNNIQEPEE